MNKIIIQDQITVNAPINKVWEAIQNPSVHAEWHPLVTHIAGEHKLGAIRKCDVAVGKKVGHTEERCTTYEEGRKILWRVEKDTTGFSNMVSDWAAGFSLEQKDSNTTLVTAESVFLPKKFFVRLMLPFIRRKFHQTHRVILGGLKSYVEK